MKKLVLLVSLISSFAFAQRSMGGGAELNAKLGFTSGAANLGVDYEKDSGMVGWGGYFFMQSEQEDANVLQTMAFGGMMKLHVVKNSTMDAYIAPGFGIAMISDVQVGNEEDDKTVFGPSMKIGGQYYLNSTTKIGLERFMINNWFDDELTGSLEYTSVVLGFEF